MPVKVEALSGMFCWLGLFVIWGKAVSLSGGILDVKISTRESRGFKGFESECGIVALTLTVIATKAIKLYPLL